MKGNIIDFLAFAADNSAVAAELAAIAKKHSFELTDELDDKDLDAVAGGAGITKEQLAKLEKVIIIGAKIGEQYG